MHDLELIKRTVGINVLNQTNVTGIDDSETAWSASVTRETSTIQVKFVSLTSLFAKSEDIKKMECQNMDD